MTFARKLLRIDDAISQSSPPTTFDMTILTTAASQDYTINIITGTSPNILVDWGDGVIETFSTTGQKTHVYSAAGLYTAKLSGSFVSGGNLRFGSNGANNFRLKGITAFPFIAGLTDLSYSLLNCNGLTGSIPADLFRYNPLVTNLAACLGNCNGLTGSISADLFRYNPLVTDLSYSLVNCTGLTGSIPADLFRYNPLVTNLSYSLANCTKLSFSSNIFSPPEEYSSRFLNKYVDFSHALQYVGIAAGSAGVAPALWLYDFGTGTPLKSFCFEGASLSTATNYADIPSEWR